MIKKKLKANYYIVNIQNSLNKQMEMANRYCKDTISIQKTYIDIPDKNDENYYQLVKDIKEKNMQILMINIYTILGLSKRELSIIVRLCRENDIILIEI